MYVCMYITAFASISSTVFEVEALSFAVNRFRKKTKEHSQQLSVMWKTLNPCLQAKSMNASEGKKFPWIEDIFQAIPRTLR